MNENDIKHQNYDAKKKGGWEERGAVKWGMKSRSTLQRDRGLKRRRKKVRCHRPTLQEDTRRTWQSKHRWDENRQKHPTAKWRVDSNLLECNRTTELNCKRKLWRHKKKKQNATHASLTCRRSCENDNRSRNQMNMDEKPRSAALDEMNTRFMRRKSAAVNLTDNWNKKPAKRQRRPRWKSSRHRSRWGIMAMSWTTGTRMRFPSRK